MPQTAIRLSARVKPRRRCPVLGRAAQPGSCCREASARLAAAAVAVPAGCSRASAAAHVALTCAHRAPGAAPHFPAAFGPNTRSGGQNRPDWCAVGHLFPLVAVPNSPISGTGGLRGQIRCRARSRAKTRPEDFCTIGWPSRGTRSASGAARLGRGKSIHFASPFDAKWAPHRMAGGAVPVVRRGLIHGPFEAGGRHDRSLRPAACMPATSTTRARWACTGWRWACPRGQEG